MGMDAPFVSWQFSAAKRNYEWHLTNTMLENQFEKQGGLCALSGLEMDWRSRTPYRLSLDRIDSKLHYTENKCSIGLFDSQRHEEQDRRTGICEDVRADSQLQEGQERRQMSKLNREKRALWRLKLYKRFLGVKLVGRELDVALRAAKVGIGIQVPKR